MSPARAVELDRYPDEVTPPATRDSLAELHRFSADPPVPVRPLRKSTDEELASTIERVWMSQFGEVPLMAMHHIAAIRNGAKRRG